MTLYSYVATLIYEFAGIQSSLNKRYLKGKSDKQEEKKNDKTIVLVSIMLYALWHFCRQYDGITGVSNLVVAIRAKDLITL